MQVLGMENKALQRTATLLSLLGVHVKQRSTKWQEIRDDTELLTVESSL